MGFVKEKHRRFPNRSVPILVELIRRKSNHPRPLLYVEWLAATYRTPAATGDQHEEGGEHAPVHYRAANLKHRSADAAALQVAAERSNSIICRLAPRIRSIESYVAGDRTWRVYLTDNEDVIREHAEISGLLRAPFTRSTA